VRQEAAVLVVILALEVLVVEILAVLVQAHRPVLVAVVVEVGRL
jgi:hypothetical protein